MVTEVYLKNIGAMLRVSHKSYANEVTIPPNLVSCDSRSDS